MNERTGIRSADHLLTASKILFLLYVVYSNVIVWAFFFIPRLTSILLIGSLALLIVHDGFKVSLSGYFSYFLLFAAYSVLTGIFVSYRVDTMFDTALQIIKSMITMYLILRYTFWDNNIAFSMRAFIFQGAFAAVVTLTSGIVVGDRATFSENVNVNTLGTMMVFSLGFVLFLFIKEKKKPINIVCAVALSAAFLLVILQTVSKKAIIAGLAVVILWFFCSFRSAFSKNKKVLRFGILIALIALIIFAYGWFVENYQDSYEFILRRFSQILDGGSTRERLLFIKSALETFLDHPLLGVGLNNFRYYNSVREVYSHCFYTEILACSGIVGSAIFVIPMIGSSVSLVRVVKNKRKSALGKERDPQTVFMLALFAVFLFCCVAQIIYHVYSLFYFMSVFIAYAANERKNIINCSGAMKVDDQK